MQDVFDLEPNTKINRDNTYIVSYPHILAHFQNINKFSERDFVCCAHIVYGWMPTILGLNPDKLSITLNHGATLLTQSKQTGRLADNEIEQLAALVNNSLVGASKLLHFTAPNAFAVWDSKIYSFVFSEIPHHHRVNQVEKYRDYLSKMDKIIRRPRFQEFYESVKSKVGYQISPLRAIELIMFLNSSKTTVPTE